MLCGGEFMENKIDFTKLKVCMDELHSAYNTPGVDCLVYQNHEPIFRYFTGFRNIEDQIPINGDELYIIFSMTKMLTCTAALQLFEQSRFSMDDKLSAYLPEFATMKVAASGSSTGNAVGITTGGSLGERLDVASDGYATKPIRILDLFTMRAGLDYDLGDESIKSALAAGKTSTLDLVRAMSGKTLGFEPGTRFRYSLCHDVLGALVEIWSGEKLGDYMKEHVFLPLGMQRTFFGVPKDEETRSKIAARYSYDEHGVPKRLPPECAYNLSEDYQSGGAGLISCTEDYALFLDALACGGVGRTGKRILNEKTVELMKTNRLEGQALEDFHRLRAGYGYGLGVRTHMDAGKSGSLSPIGEFGWDGAAGAFSMVDTEQKLSFTYFQHCHKWNIAIQSKMRNALYSCLDR